MVKEALQAQGEKGASVFTIKKFILTKYPTEDPIRLKYLLKRALSKGLSRGELVRPPNSFAVGATGTFMLAPKEPQHKQHQGQANRDRGLAPKPGQKEITKNPSAPLAGAEEGPTKQQVTAAKRKPRPKPVDGAEAALLACASAGLQGMGPGPLPLRSEKRLAMQPSPALLVAVGYQPRSWA
ncbi:hypothetical protein WISP_65145 [Willisornis vidua]|uniref:H15 domain-containing protein n=1 Tax=Willisornis vidua TaxID=1566151 RepID=A0ABQ9DAI9_9PASS|nr:hypothetical protein WISP_65145 [Willisornis vidua]